MALGLAGGRRGERAPRPGGHRRPRRVDRAHARPDSHALLDPRGALPETPRRRGTGAAPEPGPGPSCSAPCTPSRETPHRCASRPRRAAPGLALALALGLSATPSACAQTPAPAAPSPAPTGTGAPPRPRRRRACRRRDPLRLTLAGGHRARAPPAAHDPGGPGVAGGGAGAGAPGAVQLLPALRPPDRGPDRRVRQQHDRPADTRATARFINMQGRQLIYDFGKTAALVDEAQAGSRVAAGELERVRDLVVQNVRQSYFGVLQARRLVAVADAALARSELNLRSARGFFDVGTKPKSDVTRAEVEVANARVGVIRARNLVRFSETQPRQRPRPRRDGADRDRRHPHLRARGDRPGAARRGGAREPARAPAGPGPAGRVARPVGRGPRAVPPRPHGERQRGLHRRRRGDRHRRVAGVAFSEQWSITGQLSWNLFEGFFTQNRVKETQALIETARANYESIELQVRLEVEQAYIAVVEADERIGATEKAIESARENLRLGPGPLRRGGRDHPGADRGPALPVQRRGGLRPGPDGLPRSGSPSSTASPAARRAAPARRTAPRPAPSKVCAGGVGCDNGSHEAAGRRPARRRGAPGGPGHGRVRLLDEQEPGDPVPDGDRGPRHHRRQRLGDRRPGGRHHRPGGQPGLRPDPRGPRRLQLPRPARPADRADRPRGLPGQAERRARGPRQRAGAGAQPARQRREGARGRRERAGRRRPRPRPTSSGCGPTSRTPGR